MVSLRPPTAGGPAGAVLQPWPEVLSTEAAISASARATHHRDAGRGRVPLVIDEFARPEPAARVARWLASCPVVAETSIDGADYAIGRIEMPGADGFDLDRWWTQQLLEALISPPLVALFGRLSGIDPGAGAEIGAHVLERGDRIGWHDDRARGQRLGFVWFASDPAPEGGQLLLGRPRGVEPRFNRLVVFDARRPHRVEPVVDGVRRTLVVRTRELG